MVVQPENLIGRTLYSRVSTDATCKVLAVSPDKSDASDQWVYFCEITEWGQIDYQALREGEIQKYYNEENNQDLVTSYEHLFEQAMRMQPERILISEIRGDEAGPFLKGILSGHDGVITTLHAATPHRELTDKIFEWLKARGSQSYIVEDSTSTGMCTAARLLIDPEIDYQEPFLFIEDTREIKGIQVIDHPGDAGSSCRCGQRAMFNVSIHGQRTALCPICLATLGKSVIDALA